MRNLKKFMFTKLNGEKLTEGEKVLNVGIVIALVITLIALI